MQVVILVGGPGTRVYPLRKAPNKHLLQVGSEPMFFHPVRLLSGAGSEDMQVVPSTDHMGDVVRSHGSGRELGCQLTFRVQVGRGSIACAPALAEAFARRGGVCGLLGGNRSGYTTIPSVRPFLDHHPGVRIENLELIVDGVSLENLEELPDASVLCRHVRRHSRRISGRRSCATSASTRSCISSPRATSTGETKGQPRSCRPTSFGPSRSLMPVAARPNHRSSPVTAFGSILPPRERSRR